jgi:hypothetical protein
MKAPSVAQRDDLMSRSSKSLGVFLLVMSSGWIGTAQAADARPSKPAPTVVRDTADEWFDKGSAAYDAHRLQEAESAFLEAWKLKKTTDIAANLGQVESELGKHRQAATFFSYAVKNAAPTDSQEARRDVKQRLEDARKLVGVVHVRVNLPGATVSLNGESIGVAPLAEEVFAEPGSATFTAKLAGYTDARAVVEVGKGSSVEAVLELVPSVSESEGPNPAIVIGGTATAGVALGIGVLFAVLSNGKASDAKALGGWDPCYGPTPPVPNRCVELDGLRRSSATFGNVSFWSFVGAGAVGASTLVYALVASKKEKAPPTVGFQIAPVPMASGGGVIVGGQW